MAETMASNFAPVATQPLWTCSIYSAAAPISLSSDCTMMSCGPRCWLPTKVSYGTNPWILTAGIMGGGSPSFASNVWLIAVRLTKSDMLCANPSLPESGSLAPSTGASGVPAWIWPTTPTLGLICLPWPPLLSSTSPWALAKPPRCPMTFSLLDTSLIVLSGQWHPGAVSPLRRQ